MHSRNLYTGESDGSVILIPFNPPLDRSLSYTVSQSQPGKGGTTVSVVRHYEKRRKVSMLSR